MLKTGPDAENRDDIRIAGGQSDCAGCPLKHYGLCAQLTLNQPGALPKVRKLDIRVRARQNLYHATDRLREAAIIREGFSFGYVALPGGRRQILSFSMPGDFLSTSMMTKGRMNFSIQALTPLRLCVFDKAELEHFIGVVGAPASYRTFARACMAEKENLETRLVDLGRRTAEERIVRLLLEFRDRFIERGASGGIMPWPLKQQHMADALGLTQVHVSRIMSGLRRAGLIGLSGGQIEILDLDRLRRIATDSRI